MIHKTTALKFKRASLSGLSNTTDLRALGSFSPVHTSHCFQRQKQFEFLEILLCFSKPYSDLVQADAASLELKTSATTITPVPRVFFGPGESCFARKSSSGQDPSLMHGNDTFTIWNTKNESFTETFTDS